jgi:hypothetical protein
MGLKDCGRSAAALDVNLQLTVRQLSVGLSIRFGHPTMGPYKKPIHGDWDNEPQLSDDIATRELRGQILIVTLNNRAAHSS